MVTPYERVQTAWANSDRRAELNGVIEKMAAEGVSRDQLDDALLRLLDDVWAQGFDEATEDIINGVCDRLHGWCHESRRIHTLPTGGELLKLPRWAQVAFAARCARRVLPLFPLRWPDAPESYKATLTWAVQVGERSAAHAGAIEDWAPPAGAITCAAYVCDAVSNANRDQTRAREVIRGTIKAVAKFKDLAEDVLDRFIGDVFQSIFSHVVGSIANHLATSPETYAAAVPFVHGIVRRDFDTLAKDVGPEHWTNETPVPPSVFGPMWPSSAPSGWPPVQDTEPVLTQNSVRSIVHHMTHLMVA